AQVAQWKKIGYSLMLRLGMRYSKIDATKAASIAQEAYAGGVMQSNADNVVIKGYSAANPNNFSALQRNVSPYFYYLAQPFVDQLKNTKDPRLKYDGASYIKPQDFTSTRDTTTANQFGYPVGYDQQSVVNAPGYRGTKGGGQNYTQLNYDVVANILTPQFFITYSQTQLLLAEASFRGWVTGSLSTQQYYEAGIKASMDEYALYPNVQTPAISLAEENWFVAQPAVLYNNTNALQLINTQYWISSFENGPEGFANLRRSGFPVLQPNMYNNNLNGGFVRRMAYPDAEDSQNSANYRTAVTSMGGDGLTQKIFWDIP
ncbi:MAG: SusD/RagB family nutrient-binding outer membrane lipoprotein, partial [Mucilaginibacter sp.]